MMLKKGQVVDIFLDYKEQKDMVGTAVLLIRNDSKAVLPPVSFFSKEENEKKERINKFLLTTPLFKGESDGKEYRVKPIKQNYNMYTFEYWLVEFIDSKMYPTNFKKWVKIRTLLGSYSSLKEMSELSTGTYNFKDEDD